MQVIGNQIFSLKEVNSTNDFVAELIKSKKTSEGLAVFAEKQGTGRGRGDNLWTSARNKNILLSIALYPGFLEIQNQFYLSKAMALGIFDFLSNYNSDVSIKWPNDIYIGNKKISGTLIEQTVSGAFIQSSVIGIGININQVKFGKQLQNPVSLKKLSGINYNLKECIDNLLFCLDFRYNQLRRKDFKTINTEYNSRLFQVGELANYRTESGIIQATIKGVNEFGQLIMQNSEKGEMVFNMDELSFIL